MTEVHRVAAVAIRSAGHQALRRNREAGPAPAFARAIVADEAVLQVSPREQGQRPELNSRQAPLDRGLRRQEHDRPENQAAVRGAGEPPRRSTTGPAHALAGSVFGMNRMKRFAATIVPARKANGPGRPELSAPSPPRSGPAAEPRAR